MHDQFNKVIDIRREEQRKRRQFLMDKSKLRLQQNLQTKFKTCFIGALDSIEKYLGYLWGKGKNENNLTPRERQMINLWTELRTEILNKGNNQSRSAVNEIQEYDIMWRGKEIEFKVGDQYE